MKPPLCVQCVSCVCVCKRAALLAARAPADQARCCGPAGCAALRRALRPTTADQAFAAAFAAALLAALSCAVR